MSRRYIKIIRLYSFKIGVFQVYLPSEARISTCVFSRAGKSMLLKKSRGNIVFILSLFALAAALPAQTVSSVRIYTDPDGLEFWVDGQQYQHAVTLLWPQGSKHSITTIPTQNGIQPKTAFGLSGMTTNLGNVADFTAITADPGLTWIMLSFGAQYAVDLNYFVCPTGTNESNCPSPGRVILGNQTFIQNGEVFVSPGGTISAQAFPNPGWVFAGWLPVPGSGNASQAFTNTWTVNTPITIYPV